MPEIPSSEYDLSAVQEPMRQHAIPLFKEWRAALPSAQSRRIKLPPEDALIGEIAQCFGDSLTKLRDEDFSNRPAFWEHGFILGFTEGNLATKWFGRYLLPTNTGLVNALWWKHALSLLAADSELLINIEQQIQLDMESIASPNRAGCSARASHNPWLPPDESAQALSYWNSIKLKAEADVIQSIKDAVEQFTGSQFFPKHMLTTAFEPALPQLLSDNFLTRPTP